MSCSPILPAGGECGVSHQRRFKMPAPATEDSPWYSFDFGPIHFLQYSTEVPFNKGSRQHRCGCASRGSLAQTSSVGCVWLVRQSFVTAFATVFQRDRRHCAITSQLCHG